MGRYSCFSSLYSRNEHNIGKQKKEKKAIKRGQKHMPSREEHGKPVGSSDGNCLPHSLRSCSTALSNKKSFCVCVWGGVSKNVVDSHAREAIFSISVVLQHS